VYASPEGRIYRYWLINLTGNMKLFNALFNTSSGSRNRYWEIDLLRGVAVLAMITYHAIFDLTSRDIIQVDLYSPGLEWLASFTAGTFFVIVGVSLYISYSKTRTSVKDSFVRFKKYAVRAGKLMLWGGLITVITIFLYSDAPILFGALHFIGASILLGYVLLELTDRAGPLPHVLVFTIIAAGTFILQPYVRSVDVSNLSLVWLGAPPPTFQSLDYFPLVPWFGFISLGVLSGIVLYPRGERLIELADRSNLFTEVIGQNSLTIYLIHQPLLYLGIIAFSLIS